MNTATRKLLSESDLELVLATEKRRLDRLDEEELIELHARVRRARNKYSKLYRRQASAQVTADSSRGAASKKNQRSAAKAEAFEDALARVSRRLATVARRAADDLRAERIAAAKAAKKGRKPSRKPTAPAGPTGKRAATSTRGDAAHRSPVKQRTTASTRAAGKRKQAKRDAR